VRKFEPNLPELELPPVTQRELCDYAAASGDPNPIHLDPAAASRAGLPGVIAHGMLIASKMVERARVLRPGADLARAQFRFKAMTLLGDRLILKAQDGGEGRLELQAVKADGTVVCTAAFQTGPKG
jgi:acyl dehydratase